MRPEHSGQDHGDGVSAPLSRPRILDHNAFRFDTGGAVLDCGLQLRHSCDAKHRTASNDLDIEKHHDRGPDMYGEHLRGDYRGASSDNLGKRVTMAG